MRNGSGRTDFADLINLAFPWQEWFLEDELAEDAADGPHVDGSAVLCRAEKEFRGPEDRKCSGLRV